MECSQAWSKEYTFRGPWGVLLDFLRFPCKLLAIGLGHGESWNRKSNIPCSMITSLK